MGRGYRPFLFLLLGSESDFDSFRYFGGEKGSDLGVVGDERLGKIWVDFDIRRGDKCV